MAWRAQAQQAQRDRRQGAAAAAANPFAMLGDGDADDDEEMAEAVLGCELGASDEVQRAIGLSSDEVQKAIGKHDAKSQEMKSSIMNLELHRQQFVPDHCETFDLQNSDTRVHVDFYNADRKRKMKVQVEDVVDEGVICEARGFADLVGPLFHVSFDGGDGVKVPDGGSVDLIVEISNTHDGHALNMNSLTFIKKSNDEWRGVSGGKFEMVAHAGGRQRLRGRITADSFSPWGVACCHVNVVAHHIQHGEMRKLVFLVYSGEPPVCCPIPRDVNKLYKNTYVPELSGFITLSNRAGDPLVLKHDGEIQIECNGIVSDPQTWRHAASSSISCAEIEVDAASIAEHSPLKIKILKQESAWIPFQSRVREHVLQVPQPSILPPPAIR